MLGVWCLVFGAWRVCDDVMTWWRVCVSDWCWREWGWDDVTGWREWMTYMGKTWWREVVRSWGRGREDVITCWRYDVNGDDVTGWRASDMLGSLCLVVGVWCLVFGVWCLVFGACVCVIKWWDRDDVRTWWDGRSWCLVLGVRGLGVWGLRDGVMTWWRVCVLGIGGRI